MADLKIVSISRGPSSRNKSTTIDLLGMHIEIDRLGTDGDMQLYQNMLKIFDGQASAIGLGGLDLYLVANGQRYPMREVQGLIKVVKKHTGC